MFHISHGMFRPICLAACTAVVSGLIQPLTQNMPRTRSVLILGSSVDRYATENFCGKADKFYRVKCTDKDRGLAVGFWFHPGVGINGDLQPPFFNESRYGAGLRNPISDRRGLSKLSIQLLGEQSPDLVVVESSLWDLATWASWGFKNVTDERLSQWGDSDLRKLLHRVSETFNKSRIVFRNAPTVYKTRFLINSNTHQYSDVAVSSADAIYKMNHELHKHLRNGKLYGKFEVINYNKIMDDLIKERGFRDPSLWLKDGYHPSGEPSKRYFNKILELMNMTTVAEKHLE